METTEPVPSWPPVATISFDVVGAKPGPQGSKVAFTNRYTGKAQNKEQCGDTVKAWRSAVSQSALMAMGGRAPFDGGKGPDREPVGVMISFWFPRPGTTPKRKFRFWQATGGKAGDIDKLVRSTFDAMTGIVVRDDSQFCLLGTTKMQSVTGRVGAHIDIFPLREIEEAGFEVQLQPVLVDRAGVLPDFYPTTITVAASAA